jgi:hypothetical protein
LADLHAGAGAPGRGGLCPSVLGRAPARRSRIKMMGTSQAGLTIFDPPPELPFPTNAAPKTSGEKKSLFAASFFAQTRFL